MDSFVFFIHNFETGTPQGSTFKRSLEIITKWNVSPYRKLALVSKYILAVSCLMIIFNKQLEEHTWLMVVISVADESMRSRYPMVVLWIGMLLLIRVLNPVQLETLQPVFFYLTSEHKMWLLLLSSNKNSYALLPGKESTGGPTRF